MKSDAPIRVHRRGLQANQDYYDAFSEWYDRGRDRGYHALLDDLAVRVVAPYCDGRRVLEVGCGTGLILSRIAQYTDSAVGMDLSAGMLQGARERGQRAVQGSATDLPFADGSFDTVYSFKVLAHVEAIDDALREMARVTRPGGHLVLDFYNRRSLRWLIKRLKPAQKVAAEGTTDHEVFTRYDDLDSLRDRLPPELRLVDVAGIRIVTPFAGALKLPVVGRMISALEHRLVRSPLASFGGFLVLILERV